MLKLIKFGKNRRCLAEMKLLTNKTAFQYDAYRPIGNRTCFSFSCYHWMSLLGGRVGPQINKFEQVSSDYHQMSPVRGVGYTRGGRVSWGG